MYLEISPRQTGKTERLIDEVKLNYTEYGIGSVIFVPNKSKKKNIEDELNIKALNSIPIEKQICIVSNLNELENIDLNNKYLYFDEFDFIDWINIIEYHKDSNYYCTTPKFIRNEKDIKNLNDPLINLLFKNDYRYISHRKVIFDNDLKNHLTIREMEGKFHEE